MSTRNTVASHFDRRLGQSLLHSYSSVSPRQPPSHKRPRPPLRTSIEPASHLHPPTIPPTALHSTPSQSGPSSQSTGI